MSSGLKFRSLLLDDAEWAVEIDNDPEAAKYKISIYPRTEHEIRETIKQQLEEGKVKHIVAELDGEPAGSVGLWFGNGRARHIAWLGMAVRRKHWGKGVGSGLMKEVIKLAKELGCRKLMLGTFEGNERAMRLYKKFGFKVEAYEDEEVYIDGSWRRGYIMGLEVAPCEPKIAMSSFAYAFKTDEKFSQKCSADINVRQLTNHDLDEIHRLQNCPESTKSSSKVPPVTKEETKRWYEGLKSNEGKYCLSAFKNKKLLGYLAFRASPLPFQNLKFEEIIVDINQNPQETTDTLITAIKNFKQRYGYHRIFAYIPETSSAFINALKHQGFSNTGTMKSYYLINGHYVNVGLYGYQ